MGERRKHAVVIGGGFGGLAAAIRLQSSGIGVTLVEKRDRLGGRAYVYKDDGFTFDAGPTVITAPQALEELFALSGRKLADYVELIPVAPFYRLAWEDGYRFDYGQDLEETLSQIRAKSPEDAEGYEKFLEYSKEVFREGYGLVDTPFLNWWDMVRVSPALVRLQSYRSVYARVSRFIRDPQLRQAFSFHSLLVGGNPFSASAIYTLIHYLERNWGVTFPRGGTGALVEGLARLFRELGGEIELSAEVEEIEAEAGAVRAVRLKSGRRIAADAVVSNADVVHTLKDLLKSSRDVDGSRKRALKMRQSMSLFLIYFGVKKKYPDVAHHTVIFGPRYRELLDDIFRKGKLAEDFSLYLHAPTRTDPSLAPEGCEAFYVLSPVPNLGRGDGIDWEKEGPAYAERILTYLEKHHLPGLKDAIVTKRIFTPEQFRTELNSHQGAAFSFEPLLTQSAYFRTPNRSPDLKGLYFVGAGTHPGAGVPGVVNSAKATSRLVLEDLLPERREGRELVQAQAAIARGSKSFTLASRLFPSRMRHAAAFVYGWCRFCDDEVDRNAGDTPERLAERVARLRERTRDALAGRAAGDVVSFRAFGQVARAYSIPEHYPLELIEGMAMDARSECYRTLSDLERYCYRVAGTVGLMMTHVMGLTDARALRNACDLGIAMQLTNIARDVLEDFELGRIYLPLEWLGEEGLEPADVGSPEKAEAVARVVKRLLLAAEERYRSGQAGIRDLPLVAAFAIAAAALIYHEIGVIVASRGPRAWDRRAVVPLARKLWLVTRAVGSVLLTVPGRIARRRAVQPITEIWRQT